MESGIVLHSLRFYKASTVPEEPGICYTKEQKLDRRFGGWGEGKRESSSPPKDKMESSAPHKGKREKVAGLLGSAAHSGLLLLTASGRKHTAN